MDNSTLPSYRNYFAGVEATAINSAEPCEEMFIKSLLDDLFYFSIHAVLYFPEAVVDAKLGFQNNFLESNIPAEMKHLREVIKQCHRLKESPELFPSVSTQRLFLSKAAQTAKVLGDLRNMTLKDNNVRTGENNLHAWSASPANDDHTKLPDMLPDQPGGLSPWNTWLNNSVKPTDGWIALQQKIPRVGDFMNLRKTILYHQKESKFLEENDDSPTELVIDPNIGRAGDPYKHMTWSGFCAIPYNDVGFWTGGRKKQDVKGVITLEQLSKTLVGFTGPANYAQFDHMTDTNVPFFRFAMGYQN
ncbi:hypothetical protein F5884DRAFT_861224 [Xylogone sp. PMI_703]|nr:hypothetical protein F5884DRAFT_861224 [Xylogone sp. PMI_703]